MTRDELPAAYRAASDSSRRGKEHSIRLSAVQLILPTGASLLGGVQNVPGGWLNIQKARDAEEAISREHTMWQARREAS